MAALLVLTTSCCSFLYKLGMHGNDKMNTGSEPVKAAQNWILYGSELRVTGTSLSLQC